MKDKRCACVCLVTFPDKNNENMWADRLSVWSERQTTCCCLADTHSTWGWYGTECKSTHIICIECGRGHRTKSCDAHQTIQIAAQWLVHHDHMTTKTHRSRTAWARRQSWWGDSPAWCLEMETNLSIMQVKYFITGGLAPLWMMITIKLNN